MHGLYLKYINNDTDYYQKSYIQEENKFKVNLSNEEVWCVEEDGVLWTMYYIKNKVMNKQGFKIHISTTYENAENTLNLVTKVLEKNMIPFKHVTNNQYLYNMYSKHGKRETSGKFITIYPEQENLIQLIIELENALEGQPKGPYILTDKRWKSSNIYYRYGAFIKMKNENGEYCILNPEGKLVVDERKAKFTLPNFIKLPFELESNQEEIINTNIENRLKLYNIEKALRFSNAGGIYLATRKEDGAKCIIKEARNEIGLDGQGKSAMYRLQVEYEALTKLKNVDGVVKSLDYFQVWENKFLVLEFIEEVSLYSWVSKNYPFSNKLDTKEYFEDVKKILDTLLNIMIDMHSVGIAMCDMQPNNILIDDNLNVTVIDFEVSEDVNKKSKSSMNTIGYSHKLNELAREKDWYSLNRLSQFMLLPIGPVSHLDMSINEKHCLWINETFGTNAYEYFYKFQMKTLENISNKDLIFLNTLEKAKESIDNKKENNCLYNEDDIMEKLKNELLNNCDINKESFINGDVRQFETDCGMYNLQNGGMGASLTLLRLYGTDNIAKEWIEKHLHNIVSEKYNLGFFTGSSGVACVLYEYGYKKEALKLIDFIANNYNINDKDMSLRSGLAGIGLALACIGYEEEKETYIKEAQKIAQVLVDKVGSGIKSTGTDWQNYNTGLVDGYAGISIFLTLMYIITKKDKYLSYSEMVIERELMSANIQKTDGSIRLLDEKTNRVYHYLSNGSTGLGIAINFLNKHSFNYCFEDELYAIYKSVDYRSVLEAGLFDGVTGFLLNDLTSSSYYDILKVLNLFLIEKDNKFLVSGKMFYKASNDFYTGTAGIILGLLAFKNKDSFLCLPMVNKVI